MNLIENSNFGMGSKEFGADIPITPQEDFVNGVYSSVDEATTCGLDRLRSEDGIIPSCKLGCYHCCKQHILMNIAEARILAQYIKREFSPGEIDDLRIRTQQWHAWDNSRPGRYPSPNIQKQADLCGYEPCCPLIVENACSAYSVRPVICRTHFVVCSDNRSCRPTYDPESIEELALPLNSVILATGKFSRIIRNSIEKDALDYDRSVMLLPHWLAIEMGWDFAISQ